MEIRYGSIKPLAGLAMTVLELLLCKIKSLIVVNKEEFLLCTFLRMGYSPEQVFSPDSSA